MSAIIEPRVTFSESVLSIRAAIVGDKVDLAFQRCARLPDSTSALSHDFDRHPFVPGLTVSIKVQLLTGAILSPVPIHSGG